MKRQFIANLEDGDTVNDYFLAARKDLRESQSGAKFLGMVFKDRTGEIGGILWNNAPAVARQFEVGDVVNVKGGVQTYQDRLQIRVEQVLPLRDGEWRSEDLMVAPENCGQDWERFTALLGTVKNEWLKKLIGRLLEDKALMARFAAAAAGKKWHHAYRGGLAQHCYEVARLVLNACEVYPELDRDLLLTAVFVHDIGKLEEMTHDLLVDYTDAGKLVGHLVLGANLVDRHISAIDGFPGPLRLHLLHCILAHHGELVNGSPVPPKTLEALTLYHCDNLSAQVNAFSRIIAETKDRHDSWSEFVGLINRQVWAGDE